MKRSTLLLILLAASCSSPQRVFVSYRNASIGEPFYLSWDQKIVRQKNDKRGGEVLVIQEGKCQYRVYLDKNRVVTGWDYVSDPKDCGIDVDWSAPW